MTTLDDLLELQGVGCDHEDGQDYSDPSWDAYDDYREMYSNMEIKDLTDKAKSVVDTITDNIFFMFEDCSYDGKNDIWHPCNSLWSLYIFVKKEDGSVHHLKFYREVYESCGDVDKEIDYEADKMTKDDLYKFEKFL